MKFRFSPCDDTRVKRETLSAEARQRRAVSGHSARGCCTLSILAKRFDYECVTAWLPREKSLGNKIK